MGDNIILVHGFFRSEKDMFPMKEFLRERTFNALTVNLPTTFESIKQCTKSLNEQFNQLSFVEGKTHFVGHSMGGLVLLNFLSQVKIANSGRCVLIGTPVKGSALANIAFSLSSRLTKIFKGLASLRTKEVAKLSKNNINNFEFGVIAGDKNRLLTGLFLDKDSDGRVSVESTKFSGMKDFTKLPYVHTEIHHEQITSDLVSNFINFGFFNNNNN